MGNDFSILETVISNLIVKSSIFFPLTFLAQTLLKRVALHSIGTRADGSVVNYGTFCIPATYARAWILAAIVNASQGLLTVSIGNALRSTRFVRVSEVVFNAFTNRCFAICRSATCINTARRWIAWISRFSLWRRRGNCETLKEL